MTVAVNETPEQDTETLDISSQKNPATGLEVQPKAKSSFVVKTVATGVVRIDALNSLTQEIGQLQSSSYTTAAPGTPLFPATFLVGSSTIIINSDRSLMIGTHVVQPTDSPYEFPGTTYALGSSKSALIVNGISTYAVRPAQHASNTLHAAALTINGITVTLNSASNYVFETQTLKPGGPAVTVSETRISLASNAATVVVGF